MIVNYTYPFFLVPKFLTTFMGQISSRRHDRCGWNRAINPMSRVRASSTMTHSARCPGRQRRGQALITVAVALVALMGFVGLAIDVGMDDGRPERAAERRRRSRPRRMRGALYKQTTATGRRQFDAQLDPRTRLCHQRHPVQQGQQTVSLANGTVTTGCWNLTGTPAGMQSKTKSPLVTGDAAAVRVQLLKKATGQNGGPVALFLAPAPRCQLRGPIQASAVAVVSYPSSVAPQRELPDGDQLLHVPGCSGTPRPTSPRSTPSPANPTSIRIGSSYHYAELRLRPVDLDVHRRQRRPHRPGPDRERQSDRGQRRRLRSGSSPARRTRSTTTSSSPPWRCCRWSRT